jgi:tripeptidyl-peptidase-1
MMFSSGDFGVGDGDPDPKTTKCHTNGEMLGREKNLLRFMATFPATYVIILDLNHN